MEFSSHPGLSTSVMLGPGGNFGPDVTSRCLDVADFSTVVELQSVSVRLLLSRSLQCNLVATLIIAIPLKGMVTIQN